DLDNAWDYATREELMRELELTAITLFDELDRHSLAVYVAEQLASADTMMEHVRARQQEIAGIEEWFRDHVAAFLPAAPLAGAAARGWKSYECQDPQNLYKALFDIAHPDVQQEVVVSFYRNGHRAGDLAGKTVRLRGVAATIDAQGRAGFRRSALEKETGPL